MKEPNLPMKRRKKAMDELDGLVKVKSRKNHLSNFYFLVHLYSP